MVIDGWKQIASALGVSVRTARNWRRALGLPVGNLTPRRVVASAAALAEWRASRCPSLPLAAVDGGGEGVSGRAT